MERVSSISERLREYRSMFNLTLLDLSVRTGIPAQTLNRYELSQRAPKIDVAIRIAEALNISPLWLQGYNVPIEAKEVPLPKNLVPIGPMEKIPLLGTIACGEPILAAENIRDHIDLPGHIHADFALECKGDSMVNAGIVEGDIVYIRGQEQVENGEIAAVLIGDEATLKRFYHFEDKVMLNAENPAYPPFVFVGEEINSLRILGKAVAYTHFIG